MERKLASLQKIKKIEPIAEADAIEKATVLGWELVVKKGEFSPGDWCVYCEVDSIMPEREEFEFLRPRGFRIKTIRLRGQVSQGIAFPLKIIENFSRNIPIEEGSDLTDILGIKKYVPSIPAHLSGKVKGAFPGFIIKTDETRIQAVPEVLERQKDKLVYITEKLDGTSGTFYYKDGVFGVCSRNLELYESEDNTYWKMAKQYDLENKLKDLSRNIALQGEVVGNGIQKNKYRLDGQKLFIFSVVDLDTYKYLPLVEWVRLCENLELDMVPMIKYSEQISGNVNFWVEKSKGISQLYNTKREGIVVRTVSNQRDPELGFLSFKVINPDFLLKHGE